MVRPRLLFLVTEDWFFLSYRLDLARTARDAGYDVIVATRIGRLDKQLKAENFTIEPLAWERGSLNPFKSLRDMVAITRVYRRARPDIVHNVALKPILLGSIAALFFPGVVVVNSLSGLGNTFIDRRPQTRLLAWIVRQALQLLLRRRATMTIVENEDDRRFLTDELGVPEEQTKNLGGGIELSHFPQMPLPDTQPIAVACAARMLVSKGIGDLVAASQMLRARGVAHRLILAGGDDPENPGSIPAATLQHWAGQEGIEWRGNVADIREVWRQAAIAVLPSLREGLPRALMEAAACGRPLVATDVPGCRAVAHADINALLVPASDPGALADAIERLIRDPELRARFAAESRRIALAEFSLQRLLAATLQLYSRLLPGRAS